MKSTKIDWCDCTINPVVGCPRGCKYCYAERMNKRYGFVKDWKKPEFKPERLKQLKNKTPKSIFMDSMSDIAFWKEKWIDKVIEACDKKPQHKYIFLTKSDCNNSHWGILSKFYLGKTITQQSDLRHNYIGTFDFWSIEPLLEPISFPTMPYDFGNGIKSKFNLKQVIIGAETGNRKGKVIPKKEWVTDIVRQCDKQHIRVFMKESLRKIMGDDFRQDPLIWEVQK